MRKINCFLCFFLPLWDNMGEYDTEKRDKLNNLPDLGMEWRRKRRGCVVWFFGLRVKYTPEIGFNLLKFIPL